MAETPRSKRSALTSIKPSRDGPAAAFNPSELTASRPKAIRMSLSLARRRTCDSPSGEQRRTDQAGPAKQRRAGSEAKVDEMAREQSDRGEAGDGHADTESR